MSKREVCHNCGTVHICMDDETIKTCAACGWCFEHGCQCKEETCSECPVEGETKDEATEEVAEKS